MFHPPDRFFSVFFSGPTFGSGEASPPGAGVGGGIDWRLLIFEVKSGGAVHWLTFGL
jgi:hypothetical protein